MPIKTSLKPKKLFLIDAIGAIVSAFFLGVVLVHLNELVGMPVKTLYILAIIPCFFIVYSFSCHFFLQKNWAPFLRAIAIANSLYCVLTIILIGFHFEKLTALGLFYFIVEILIICILVRIQFTSASKYSKLPKE